MTRISTALACIVLLAPAGPAVAQTAGGWNDDRAIELIERARARRQGPTSAPELRNYRADARGYVYFYLDRADSDERTLVKTDQVALEVYWATPDRTKQKIVGLRDESRLPNRMHYHLDHLTVVQNEFGDAIRMGDGDEVRDVPHPAAKGTDSVYDFRLADSLTLRLPGAVEPVRVYRVQVRPQRPDEPAIIGSLFIDRATADIVRMAFTFTPAAYVDPRLDYIRVSLENGLWEGRHWLPYEQRVEIRRQVPELDFVAGSVIRGRFRIRDYAFNVPLSRHFFAGPRVISAPRSQREAFPFEDGLFDDLEAEGLEPPPEMATLREEAEELVERQYLSGLPRLRVHVPSASSVVRYNRAEALFLGAGTAYVLGNTAVYGRLGYATGPDHVTLGAEIHHDLGDRTETAIRVERNALRDLGPFPAAGGLWNTLGAAVGGYDALDPYYVNEAAVTARHRLSPRWTAGLELAATDFRSAARSTTASILGDLTRPVRSIDEGAALAATLRLDRGSGRPTGLRAGLEVETGLWALSEPFARPLVTADVSWPVNGLRTRIRAEGAAGALFGAAPAQRLFLLGGRGTLPGHPHRAFVGDRFALARTEVAYEAIRPWLTVRAFAAAGWTDMAAASAPADWSAAATPGVAASAGAGLGLVHDILRLDLARGLGGGEWQILLSVDPELWDIL